MLPTGFSPHVTHPRRYRWLKQQRATREGDDGLAAAFYAVRVGTTATALPAGFPYRAILVAAGVLAMEEVRGAGTEELRSYGLSLAQAERLIFFLERHTMTQFNYGPRVGQTYEEDEVTILASAARTSSTTSDVYEVGDKGTARLTLDITAVSGTTPSIHVQIETRKDYSSGDWRVVDAFGPKTAVGSERRSMSGLDRFVRAVCTIAGTTPSFTFSLTGETV